MFANRHLVGPILNVELLEMLLRVRVYQNLSVLRQIVDQNVWATVNAPITWLASTRNVKILVLEPVARTQNVE